MEHIPALCRRSFPLPPSQQEEHLNNYEYMESVSDFILVAGSLIVALIVVLIAWVRSKITAPHEGRAAAPFLKGLMNKQNNLKLTGCLSEMKNNKGSGQDKSIKSREPRFRLLSSVIYKSIKQCGRWLSCLLWRIFLKVVRKELLELIEAILEWAT